MVDWVLVPAGATDGGVWDDTGTWNDTWVWQDAPGAAQQPAEAWGTWSAPIDEAVWQWAQPYASALIASLPPPPPLSVLLPVTAAGGRGGDMRFGGGIYKIVNT